MENIVELIALGGAGEIGKNMMLIRQNEQIIIIDAGLAFPTDELYGVDIVIPDMSYIAEHKHEVVGIVLSHGHEDHVGALPYLLRVVNAPVYSSKLTLAMVRPKLAEKLPTVTPKLVEMKAGVPFQCGCFEVEPIRVTHSIPETCSIAIKTSEGVIAFTSDFKFDRSPVDGKLSDMKRLKELGDEGVLLLVSDSTNVERAGWGPSEREVGIELERIIKKAPGRVLITTFASNIHRMQQVITCAANLGKKVAVVGKRMEQNLEIARDLDYLKVSSDVRIRVQDVGQYPEDQIVILATGTQGEPLSALTLMSQDDYSRLRINKGDTVILSATPIPGNEDLIWRTVNRLVRQGADVIYSSLAPVHASGHAYREELRLMLELLQPRHIAPIHGEPRHQLLYHQMANEMGYYDNQIHTMDVGDSLLITSDLVEKGQRVESGRVLIDTGGYSGVPEDIIRDRRYLANDGVFIVMVAISAETGEILSSVDFMSKGFVVADALLDDARTLITDKLHEMTTAEIGDSDLVGNEIEMALKRFFRKRAQTRPVIIPIVVEM